MAKKYEAFRFKQFSVDHANATMKVGTDAVLLGAWVQSENVNQILDIGTGSGVIALMLAQRTEGTARIDAVEISENDAHTAESNFKSSPWSDKLNVINSSIQDHAPSYRYDLIVSNPPYFVSSFLPPDKRRTTARHTVTLSLDDLASSVARLLAKGGTFAVILPPEEMRQLQSLLRSQGIHPQRVCYVHSRQSKPAERCLMQFQWDVCSDWSREDLTLIMEDGSWTEEYRGLVRDFYLWA